MAAVIGSSSPPAGLADQASPLARPFPVGFTHINAKADEGIENRPAFRKAFQRRHCLASFGHLFGHEQ
jgi:hypothetical protein